MHRLPKSLTDHTRSYLPFREIFISTRVCKAWQDVTNIPKTLVVDDSNGDETPPEYVDLSHVHRLEIRSIGYNKFRTIHETIRRCSSSLRHIHIGLEGLPAIPTGIPQLPKVTTLSIWGWDQSQSLNKFLRHMPNLTSLYVSCHIISIDFSLVPDLKTFAIYEHIDSDSHIESVENVTAVSLKKIRIPERCIPLFESQQSANVEVSLGHGSWQQSTFDHIQVMTQEYPKWVFNIFLHESVETVDAEESFFVYVTFNSITATIHDVSEIGNPFRIVTQERVGSIKTLINFILAMPRKMFISPDLKGKDCSYIIALLAATGRFSREQLSELISTK